MNKIILISTIFISLLACNNETIIDDQILTSKLDKLYESEDFFKLKTSYETNIGELSDKSQFYYGALVNHVFNNQKKSNEYINKLLTEYGDELSDSILHTMYHAKRMNHINLYEYADAVVASKILIEKYEFLEDSADYTNLQNEHKIWLALRKVPKQEIIKTQDSKIIMKRDKVGLMNIGAVFGNDSLDLIFDTGANFSVIIRSLADSLHMQIIDADFYVTAATGTKVKSDLAIADNFKIADITIKNAVFLILDDKDLSFPQVDYYPNGAIGFPIIEALDELQFKKDGNIIVPQSPTHYTYNNLALNGLMPMIAVCYKNDTLNFGFDTGGSSTTLYSPFYHKYKSDIDDNYKKEVFNSTSGGGTKEFDGFVIDSIAFNVAESTATLKKIRLHGESIFDATEKSHGNFGQDYIKQFDKMIISFKHSSVVFE